MPKPKLLQIGDITPRMASRLEANFDIIEYFKFEDKKKLFGRSEHMTSVIFDGKEENIGKLIPVKIVGSNKNTLFGKMIENYNKKVA